VINRYISRPLCVITDITNVDPLFYEARAIIFSRLGQHKQALEIYVFELKNPVKAEE